VNNGVSRPLIDWTEVPGLNAVCESGVNLKIIVRPDHIIFILNGKWIAEAQDDSVLAGRPGFALVSFDSDACDSDTAGKIGTGDAGIQPAATCQARLDFFSVDSRAPAVEAEYKKWKDSTEISAESRLRLAENLAALGRAGAAYDQILKAWKSREAAARSVTATYTEMRTREELLLAARMAGRLGRHETAEEYINTYFTVSSAGGNVEGKDGPDVTEALAEKAMILSSLKKYGDLAAFLPEYIGWTEKAAAREVLPSLYALLGHACRNLNDFKAAAAAWATASSLDPANGLYAAAVSEMTGEPIPSAKKPPAKKKAAAKTAKPAAAGTDGKPAAKVKAKPVTAAKKAEVKAATAPAKTADTAKTAPAKTAAKTKVKAETATPGETTQAAKKTPTKKKATKTSEKLEK
jgi:tetratricopeptide (TPR) repeat protein